MKSSDDKDKAEMIDGPYLILTDTGMTSLRVEKINGEFKSESKIYSSDEISHSLHKVSLPSLNSDFTFKAFSSHSIVPHHYEEQNKIFAISDIEGDFDYFRAMLIAQKIMNDNYEWIFGEGHLVILGDIFDRGDLVTEVLWLMYKLEQEARSQGGFVHIILGNHESMCLSGDLRYLNKKYLEVTQQLHFPYHKLYGPNTVLGDWLRSKNSIEVIGNTLFVHGGISPVLSASGLSIQEINETVRNTLDKTETKIFNSTERLVMNSDGPLWCRDYLKEELDQDVIDSILNVFGAEQIVIGHTVVDEVSKYYDGKVIAIDIKRKNKEFYEALLIENGLFYRATSEGNKISL